MGSEMCIRDRIYLIKGTGENINWKISKLGCCTNSPSQIFENSEIMNLKRFFSICFIIVYNTFFYLSSINMMPTGKLLLEDEPISSSTSLAATEMLLMQSKQNDGCTQPWRLKGSLKFEVPSNVSTVFYASDMPTSRTSMKAHVLSILVMHTPTPLVVT